MERNMKKIKRRGKVVVTGKKRKVHRHNQFIVGEEGHLRSIGGRTQ